MESTETFTKTQLELGLEAPALPLIPEKDWRAEVPSVSQLTRRIRGHLENSFFDCWVRGEISNFKKPVSGHGYFILKDANSQLRAVMFRPALSKLKFQLKDGMEVLLHGNITVYEARGDYQMLADTMEPVGVGALQLAFEQLKTKLHADGLFDPKYKKRLPFLPKRIGVITSATGAAVKDILKVLSRRFPNLHVLIIPASVQGEKAAPELCAALEFAQRWNTENPDQCLEVLIFGRGGGSLEDLWPFNEECVARAIFQCPIPIISAVGHEIDITISDFVADVRAPTPSAAAEIIIPRKEDLCGLLSQHRTRLFNGHSKKMAQLRLHLGHLSQRLVDPRQKIGRMREAFQNLERRLFKAILHNNALAQQKLKTLGQVLHSLSPLQVIGRGYSLTRTESGEIVRQISQAPAGTVLHTRVGDGTLQVEVLSQTSDPL